MRALLALALLIGLAGALDWSDQPLRIETRGEIGLPADAPDRRPYAGFNICDGGNCRVVTASTGYVTTASTPVSFYYSAAPASACTMTAPWVAP